MSGVKIGDIVIFQMAATGHYPASKAEELTVIGEPHYSENWSQIMLASEVAIGMASGSTHCTPTGRTDPNAARYRQRYLKKWPGFLKRIKQEPKP